MMKIMQNQIALESLPDGTSLETTAFYSGVPFSHYGIVQRAWSGGVLIHHNSKKYGGAVTTNFFEFTDGQNLARVDSIPETLGEGWVRAERARNDVALGIRWTVDNNCEDMKSRALTGHNGSPTRNAFVGIGVLGLGLFFLSK